MPNKLEGHVAPDVLERFRVALGKETSGVIKGIMTRTGCSKDAAIDRVFTLCFHRVVDLLIQPNGECLINYLLTPEESNRVIIDSEVNLINKGRTRIERPPLEILSGRTFFDPKKVN